MNSIPAEYKIPFGQQTAYGFGMLVNNIFSSSLGALIAIAVIWSYKLSEKRMNEIRDELEYRRGKIQLR